MATENLNPDGFAASPGNSNVSGAVSQIQSADGTNLTVGTGGSTAVHVTFPTPTDTLTAGAGLQTFTIVGDAGFSGSNTVTYQLDLYENGTQVTTLSLASGGTGTTATANGTTKTWTWNSTLLSVNSGANVEAYVTQTGGASGNPNRRSYLTFDHIYWTADFTTAPAVVGRAFAVIV